MILQNRTDEELMAEYQKGPEEAFRILYGRHSSKVYGFIKAKLRNEQQVNDIFQEVFVKVHKSKHLYNSSLPFMPWLFTITKNALVDDVRKNKESKNQVEVDDTLSAPELSLGPQLSELTPYFNSLPENQKKAIELRYVEEKTFEEISIILKTSPLNVRKLVSRGVKRVRELLQDGGNHD